VSVKELNKGYSTGEDFPCGLFDQPAGTNGMPTINLHQAKTHLCSLVERAAAGEEIVIAKNGVARARLVGIAVQAAQRRPANALRIGTIAADFDAPDASLARLFTGEGA
jgi:prevent-host-death family protein